MKAPVTAVVITKNESASIRRCLSALTFCDQILLVDSGSADGTADIGRAMGADVVDFVWNGKYPKKKQWGMENPAVRNNWVLHLDADEIVSSDLADELSNLLTAGTSATFVAVEVPLLYYFSGKPLAHGHRVVKRSLLDRRHCQFPEVGDLEAPGITEVEGHYQPLCDGKILRASAKLTHHDPDPVGSWVDRHNRYADWEAYLKVHSSVGTAIRDSRSAQGRLFSLIPGKPIMFFLYSFIIRRGFLDGRAGFDYAFGLTWYYWLTNVKRNELRRAGQPTGTSREPRKSQTCRRMGRCG